MRDLRDGLTLRLALEGDLPAQNALMNAAIGELQAGFLSSEQVEASFSITGLDSQLVADRTYFVVEADALGAARFAGCGGWSRRATLFGGDHSAGRDAALLDPACDAARIRSMYTHPLFTRRGIGRMILAACEALRRQRDLRAASWLQPWPASRSTGPAVTT